MPSRRRYFNLAKYFIPPFLTSIYPAVFYYANNLRLIPFTTFVKLCFFLACIGCMFYLIIVLLNRGNHRQAACGTLLFLVFFYGYGPTLDKLRLFDWIQIDTYNFLPLWLLLAGYLTWLVAIRLDDKNASQFLKAFTFVIIILLLANIVKIVSGETEKYKSNSVQVNSPTMTRNDDTDHQQISAKRYPDIYYLIFDEAASFEVAKQYWHVTEVDDFVNFLEEKGFYVAHQSHSGSIYTLREIATRLNYQEYPFDDEYYVKYYGLYNEAIGKNRVMSFLKKHGYTVIAYDERRLLLPTSSIMPADILVERPPSWKSNHPFALNEYDILPLKDVLFFRELITLLGQDIPIEEIYMHRDMIRYTLTNLASEQTPSPKFVYVHLTIPHAPFAFLRNGDINPKDYFNWQNYPENYRFFLKLSREMISNILLSSSGKAAIILQSDHGARNMGQGFSGFLTDYPDRNRTWIVNALYLPGCVNAPLTQEIDPINTFPIIFNCYFDANIPLR